MPQQLLNMYIYWGSTYGFVEEKSPWLKKIPEKSLKPIGLVASEVPSSSDSVTSF